MKENRCYCGEKIFVIYRSFVNKKKVIKCINCGLLRTYPIPKLTTSDESDIKKRLTEINLWKNFSKKIINLVKKYKKNKNLWVLDIGSNIGIFVNLCEKEGWKATGIDIDKRVINIGKKQFNCDLRETTLEKAHFKDKEFDAIVLLHTLEHVYNLKSLLKKIHQIIKKDGILVIQVPNINGLPVNVQGLRNKPWYGYDFSHHLWHFQPKTLKDLLNNNGFEIKEFDTKISMYYEKSNKIFDFARNIVLSFSFLINRADQITLVAIPKK